MITEVHRQRYAPNHAVHVRYHATYSRPPAFESSGYYLDADAMRVTARGQGKLVLRSWRPYALFLTRLDMVPPRRLGCLTFLDHSSANVIPSQDDKSAEEFSRVIGPSESVRSVMRPNIETRDALSSSPKPACSSSPVNYRSSRANQHNRHASR